MLFNPLTWAAGFALTQLFGNYLARGKFQRALATAASRWAASLPREFKINPDALFIGADLREPELSPGRRELRLQLERSCIPGAAVWEAALWEQYLETKKNLHSDADAKGATFSDFAQGFFVRDESEVRPYLAKLATDLALVCARDPIRLQTEAAGVILELKTRRGELSRPPEASALLKAPPVEWLLGTGKRTSQTSSSVSMPGVVVPQSLLREARTLQTHNVPMGVADLEARAEALSLFEFVDGCAELEEIILQQVELLIEASLTQQGYKRNGRWLVKRGDQLQLHMPHIPKPGGYHLGIVIERMAGGHSHPLSGPITVGGIGRIQEVSIECADPLPLRQEAILETVVTYLRSAYAKIEMALMRKNARLGGDLFSHLYDLIAGRLHSVGKQHLIGHFWLIIATETQILYAFDQERLRLAIMHFKDIENNGIRGRSPLDLILSLLTDTFPFEKSLAVEAWRQNRPKDLPWVKARYVDEAPLIHAAEMKLFASPAYSALVPCECRRHFLIVGCPAEIRRVLFREVVKIQDTLASYFQAGLARFSGYIGTVANEVWVQSVRTGEQSESESTDLHLGRPQK